MLYSYPPKKQMHILNAYLMYKRMPVVVALGAVSNIWSYQKIEGREKRLGYKVSIYEEHQIFHYNSML